MSSSLLLLLRGPLQSWGDASRFHDRATAAHPTKSGVLGLVAAAQGRRRTDPLEDLAALRFAVRVDQPGALTRDFQTAERWQTGGGTSLVSRYYLSDAVFLVAIGAEDRTVLEGIVEALRSPRFPLYLGRRSCPANPDLVGTAATSIVDTSPVDALRAAPWRASRSHRRTRPREVRLPIFRDGEPGERGESRQDVPVSFDQEHRRYGWRTVVADDLGALVDNPEGSIATDPFFEEVLSA